MICMPLSQKMDGEMQRGMRVCHVCNFLVNSPSLFGNYTSLTFCVLSDKTRIAVLNVPDEIRLMIRCHQSLMFFGLEEA